ncbi:MAG: lamin tail domain-containing protein [Candidatus Delongbacteria bacterium]|nr:lamin tail domain-containing protein [Candidatus Delongbacteria bacterium]
MKISWICPLLWVLLGWFRVSGADPIINEIMYNPIGDDEAEFIELYNPGPGGISLEGYRLTRGVEMVFPAGTLLDSGGYLVITKDTARFREIYGFAAGFKWSGTLSNTGEAIVLLNAASSKVDSVYYRPGLGWPSAANGSGPSLELKSPELDNLQPENWGAGLDAGGTPGSLNSLSRPVPSPLFMPSSIEFGSVPIGQPVIRELIILNQGLADYIITGWEQSRPVIFSVTPSPPFTLLPAESLKLAVRFSPSEVMPYHDSLRIMGNAGIDTIPLSGTGKKAYPVYRLVINEIMYNPSGEDSLEFIELFNPEPEWIDLEGYRLTSGVELTLPAGFGIGTGEYRVLARDTAAFINRYGWPADGQWKSGSLNNTGEAIVVENPDGITLDSVLYSSQSPWPTDANGKGPSLELNDWELDNNNGINWSASLVPGGSPGGLNTRLVPTALPVFTPNPLDFGKVRIGDTAQAILMIENKGNADFMIHHGSLLLNTAFEGDSIIQIPVAPGQTCSVRIRFSPPGSLTYHDTYQILSNLGEYSVTITGSGKIRKNIPRLIINEIMYNPSGEDRSEFIELYNADTGMVELAGYRFNRGIEHQFEEGDRLEPGEYLVLTVDTIGFRQVYPAGTARQWDGGSLNNSGEAVVLIDTDDNPVDSVFYKSASPWPTAPNGKGASLELRSPDLDNTQPENWKESRTNGGTPGIMNSWGWQSPAVPELIQPAHHARHVPIPTQFIWHHSDQAQFYHFRLGPDSTLSQSQGWTERFDLADTTLWIDSLNYRRTYYWQVRSINPADSSPWSLVYQFTTCNWDDTPPSIISLYPQPYSINVPVDSPIRIRLADDQSGIDTASIRLRIQQIPVVPMIEGDPLELELVYQTFTHWRYQDGIYVNLELSDREGNSIVPLDYYFVTVPDTDPPIFTQMPVIHHLSPGSVMGQWKNNEPCYGYWRVGERLWCDSAADTLHHPVLDSLEHLTSYAWSIWSVDTAGNSSQILNDTLITGEYPDTVRPGLAQEPRLIYSLSDRIGLELLFNEPVELEFNYGLDSTDLDHQWEDDHYGVSKIIQLDHLSASNRYWYRIALRDRSGNPMALPIRSFYTPALDDRSPEYLTQPRISLIDGNRIGLEFVTNRALLSSLILNKLNSGLDPITSHTLYPSSHHVHWFSDLSIGQTYHFQAEIYLDSDGERIPSQTASLILGDSGSSVHDPPMLRIFHWSVYRGVYSVWIRLYTDPISRPEIIRWPIGSEDSLHYRATEWSNRHWIRINNLKPGTEYGYQVRFENPAGGYYRVSQTLIHYDPVESRNGMDSGADGTLEKRGEFGADDRDNEILKSNQTGLNGGFTTRMGEQAIPPRFVYYPVVDRIGTDGAWIRFETDQPVTYRLMVNKVNRYHHAIRKGAIDAGRRLLQSDRTIDQDGCGGIPESQADLCGRPLDAECVVLESGEYHYHHECELSCLESASDYKLTVEIRNPQGMARQSDTLEFMTMTRLQPINVFLHPAQILIPDSSHLWIHAHTRYPAIFELAVTPIEVMRIWGAEANVSSGTRSFLSWIKMVYDWQHSVHQPIDGLSSGKDYRVEIRARDQRTACPELFQTMEFRMERNGTSPLSIGSGNPEWSLMRESVTDMEWETNRPSWFNLRYWIPGSSDTLEVTSWQVDVKHRARLSGLIPNVRYGWRLTVYNGDNEMDRLIRGGILSAVRSPDDVPPVSPERLTGYYSPEPSMIRLSWLGVRQAGAYDIERSENGMEYRRIISAWGDTLFEDDRIQSDQTYIYRVTALDTYDQGLRSDPSPGCEIYTGISGLSAADQAESFKIRAYPNPFSDRICLGIISTEKNRPARMPLVITIYDLMGRKVFQSQQTMPGWEMVRLEWNGRDQKNREVASGIYLMVISMGSRREWLKIVRLK